MDKNTDENTVRSILNVYNNHGHFYFGELSSEQAARVTVHPSRRTLHRRARPRRAASKHRDFVDIEDATEAMHLEMFEHL